MERHVVTVPTHTWVTLIDAHMEIHHMAGENQNAIVTTEGNVILGGKNWRVRTIKVPPGEPDTTSQGSYTR